MIHHCKMKMGNSFNSTIETNMTTGSIRWMFGIVFLDELVELVFRYVLEKKQDNQWKNLKFEREIYREWFVVRRRVVCGMSSSSSVTKFTVVFIADGDDDVSPIGDCLVNTVTT